MAETVPAARLHVLPWNRPLLPQAVAWLSREWRRDTPLDLSDALVIVPTRHSGRRLREALASFAAEHGQAVFPPQVALPDAAITRGAELEGIASRGECLLAWTQLLRELELTDFAEVFPVAPPIRSFTWAVRLARQLMRLQATLAENGLQIADVGRRAGAFPESGRWAQLAELEKRYLATLTQKDLHDPQLARISVAAQATLPIDIRRVVLLGTPDPLPLTLRWLERLIAHAAVAIDVVVTGPADESPSELFDEWGRPRPEAWGNRAFSPANYDECVHLCADPAAQAEMIATCVAQSPDHERTLAIGITDPEIIAPLRHALGSTTGLSLYDPEGRERRFSGLHRLLELLANFAHEPLFTTISALLRCPDVLAWLQRRSPHAFSPARLLAGLDELHRRYLPPDLTAAQSRAVELAQNFPELTPALEALETLQDLLAAGDLAEAATGALREIFRHRQFSTASEEDEASVDAARAWNEVLAETANALRRFGRVSRAEAWELALQRFGETVRFEDKPAGAIEAQGWLELLWEDAPHLVIGGFNDTRVPEAVVGDLFLPESLRERLGLKTNAARLARDAYLLQVLAACRAQAGRLDLLFGKTSAAGEPLRPSRLLLQCTEAELPARVQRLFRPAANTRANLPWHRAWKLRVPPPRAELQRLHVTAFRDYLACPFRFYLKHVLRMEAVDPHKAELDGRDFGNLCHTVLEEMGRTPRWRDCTDAAELRHFLLSTLDRVARDRYGSVLSLPLLIQLESARQRLSRAADVQAADRAAGWVIQHVEWNFRLAIAGLTISGKIDRIDRHERTGAWRVLDYKTADTPTTPRAAHTRSWKRNEDRDSVPDFAQCAMGDGLVWQDLQLPLYLRAVRELIGERRPQCAYFNLPRAVTETQIVTWEDYDESWQTAAETCVQGVIEAIRAQRFWPPNERIRPFEEWAGLFHQGVAASVLGPPAAEREEATP